MFFFFVLEPLVGSGEGGQATRHSSKSSTRYEDSVQQLLAVICACSNFSSLHPVLEDGGLQGYACSTPLPELHLNGEKVSSCGFVGGELVKQGRGNSGFSGEGSARRAAEVRDMQPVPPPAPCYPSPKSLTHSTELRQDTALSPAWYPTIQQALPFPITSVVKSPG